MRTTIITANIALLITAYWAAFVWHVYPLSIDFLWYSMAGFLGGFFAGYVVASILANFVPTVEYIDCELELVSMRNADGLAGAFILGSGFISSQAEYHFMYKQEDGSMTPAQVPADSTVRIFEDDTLENTGRYREAYSGPDKTSRLYGWAHFNDRAEELLRREFTVPKGAVVQTFSVQ